MTDPQRYRVFLLRLWQVTGSDGQPAWRASLEDAHTTERRGFASLAQLCAFLDAQTERRPPYEAELNEEEPV